MTDQYNNVPFTQDEIATIEQAKAFIKRKNTLGAITSNSFYYYAAQPILENNIATKSEKLLYHSVVGRVAFHSMNKLNISIDSCLVYLLSLRLNAVIEYVLNNLGFSDHGLIIATIICFVLLVIHSIFTSIQRKMILEKLGDGDIFEDTEEDILARTLNKKKN
jgi:hypothetical protein